MKSADLQKNKTRAEVQVGGAAEPAEGDRRGEDAPEAVKTHGGRRHSPCGGVCGCKNSRRGKNFG